MKKILLLMVGMLVAFASQAQLHLVGPGVNNKDWTPADPVTVQAENGWYTFEIVPKSEFQMSKIKAGWDNGFKTGALSRSGDWTGSTDDGLQSCSLTTSYDNPKFVAPADFKYARVSVAFDKMEWSKNADFSGGSEPGPVVPTLKCQIKSSIDGAAWPTHDMIYNETTGTYEYTYTGVIAGEYEMGMMIDGGWKGSTQNSKVFSGSLTTYKMDTSGGGNIMVKNYAGDILCSYNPADNNLTLSNPGAEAGERLHIHTMTMLNGEQIFPFDLNAENPYKLTITINSPLADEVPLCVHHRKDGADYVSYGYENATTYLPEGDGTTGALTSFSDQSKYITLPVGLQGTIEFAVKMVENLPSELTISGGTISQNLYTYVLWDNFSTGDELEKTQTFVPHTAHFDVTYTFDGTETGRLFKVERLLNGRPVTGRRWCVQRNSAEYVPSEVGTSYSPLSATGTDNVVLPKGIRGTVTISVYVDEDGVPERFHIKGGHFGDGPDEDYTVYFYDTTSTGSHNAPYAYMWRKEAGDKTSEYTAWWGTDKEKGKMEATGKYVYVDGVYYPAYKLSFNWENTPQHIIIHNNNTKYTDASTDCIFVNGGFYHSGSTAADTEARELVEKPGEQPATFYMHWKEDWIQSSKMGADGKPLHNPRCYVYSGALGDINAVWAAAKEMTTIDEFAPSISTDPNTFATDEARMTITEKYQIWKCDFTGAEMKEKSDVCFLMMGDDDKVWVYASRSGGFAEPEFLSKYIFATATGANSARYAVQSFIPFEDFKQLDAQGRPSVYLVGNDNGAIDGLQWTDMLNTKKIDAEQGCFYIPLTVSGGKDAQFKMSWINPADAIQRNHITKGEDDSARQWATFDLGIFGVDDIYKYPENYEKPEFKKAYAGDIVPSAFCRPWESIRYLNYNQYNWFISKDVLNFEGKCYVVVDPHSTCRTVTVIPYDPNPTVGISASNFGTMKLTEQQAKMFHGDHSSHLNGAAHNGHIYMDRVNYCSGDIEIHKSHENLRNAFDLTYSIYMNGDMVLEHDNPDDKLHLDYMPMAASGEVGVRCTYENKITHLTFHSKLGEGQFNAGEISFPQPQPIELTAIKVKDPGLEHNPDMAGNIGVLLQDVPFVVNDKTYEYYADFEFDQGERAEILHPTHRIVGAYAQWLGDMTLNGWQFLDLDNNYDFENGTNDWSTLFSKDENNAWIYLTNTGENISSVTGKIYAVYPFFYQIEPTISNPASAPRKAGDNVAPHDISSTTHNVTYVMHEVPLTVTVQDGVLSSVDNVAVDATEADAEYFTISGIRVEGDLAPGIYLRRQGDKVTKVVIP